MRLSLALCGLLLVAGCRGPHSTGALWALQNLEQEAALFRLSDAQRADQARIFEQGLASDILVRERWRVENEMASCPGVRQPLSVSPGDKVRDAIRLRAHGNLSRLNDVALLALADWRLRRAAATGDTAMCEAARGGLSGVPSRVKSDLLTRLPTATVARDARLTQAAMTSDPPSVSVSHYALGYVDTIQAAAPLPQYLAFVYGGFLVSTAQSPLMDVEAAATAVDAAAPAYPDWEPDALYAALRGAQT
jgi:hypothetical protein